MTPPENVFMMYHYLAVPYARVWRKNAAELSVARGPDRGVAVFSLLNSQFQRGRLACSRVARTRS